jgi:AAA family ATP:ADP antiporter
MDTSAHSTWLKRLIPVRAGEYRAVILAVVYFFLLMMALYLLRPLRDTFGILRGADKLPLLWTSTLALMVLVNPLYSAITARWPRRVFIPAVYKIFAAMLCCFGLLYQLLPGHGGAILGYSFHAWLGVFNLFVVSIFWAFMSDVFSKDDGRRLFGIIAIGGTLGGIAGAFTTGKISTWLGFGHFHWLFYFSALLLLLAIPCVLGLFADATRHDAAISDAGAEPGPGVLAGITLLGKSRILQSISIYVMLYAAASTFLYVFQGRIVEQAFTSNAARAAAFAGIDLWANVLTLFTQLFFTHRLVARIGIPVSLCVLPVIMFVGFGSLWIWPCFTVLAIFQVVRRGLHFAVDRPVREMIYIPLEPDVKYKAKSFIDTFVYRFGDIVGIWSAPVLVAMSVSLGFSGMSASLAWLGSSVFLGGLVKKVFGDGKLRQSE